MAAVLPGTATNTDRRSLRVDIRASSSDSAVGPLAVTRRTFASRDRAFSAVGVNAPTAVSELAGRNALAAALSGPEPPTTYRGRPLLPANAAASATTLVSVACATTGDPPRRARAEDNAVAVVGS